MGPNERLEALYEAHAGAVLAYARRRADPDSADDALAEVFVIAWRRLEEIPDDARVWLLGVARRVLANQRRSQGRREALHIRIAGEQQTVATKPAADTPDGHVLRALASLGEKDREALLLLGWEELSHREAAGVLGIRPRTFSVRAHRARRHFALALKAAQSTVGAEPTEPLESQ